jgi:glycosyltransferase involved in cell wall biosynthesis
MIRSCVQHVVAVGERVAQVHQKRFPNVPTTVIINAVDLVPPLSPEERTAVRQEIVGDPTRPLLIGVGRLVAQKAWGDLIDAFARLRTTHPSAILVIVGQGECSDEIQERITAHGLEGHVRLLGLRGDVPRLLAASDLYVSSSHLEGLSVALLEAMSAGLPVVVTGVGDAPKVVSDERGILVPPAQTEQLAEAMAAMLSYPERMRRCGKAAQRYVVERHSPMVWIDQLFTVYARAQGALSHLEPASDNA